MATPLIEKIQQTCAKKYTHFFGMKPMLESQADIENWFSCGLVQRILKQEQLFLDTLLPELFGYHLMQLSVLNDKCLYEKSSTSHQFSMNFQLDNKEKKDDSIKQTGVISSYEELGIDSDAVDVSLLHHVLDYSQHPQQLLREVTRVTIPNGYIVICGFNPYSLMGMSRPVACLFSKKHNLRYQQLRVGRLIDWFQVLGLEMMQCHRGYYGLPMNRYYSSAMDNIGRSVVPVFGSFYILVARKTVSSMTMIRSDWKSRKMIPQWGKRMVVPSISQSSHIHKKQ